MTQFALETPLLEAFYRNERALPEPRTVAKRGIGRGTATRLARLHKQFGGRAVLRGLSLNIAEGEFVAIVGRSGCGKSTLLRLLAGLDQPTEGEIIVGGKPVQGRVAEARLMFQDARLLPWRRVLDNVGIGVADNWRTRAYDALHSVGLEDRAGDWPAILSGGQRQRVALARALVSQPKLLLLDEPFGALDALTRLEMQSLVETVWLEQKFTAVLVTHDVAEAVALADRVIVLDDGVVALDMPVTIERPRHDAASPTPVPVPGRAAIGGQTSMFPKEIRLAKDRGSLEIEWRDGVTRQIGARMLRDHCRSAPAVRETVDAIAPFEPGAVHITRIEPVGGYAVNLAFSDGEERGIYPWPLLRSLGG
jgi:sulfonate transport system ATP-binding protein